MILGSHYSFQLFQNMNDEKRQKLDCATAILNRGKELSNTKDPGEVRMQLLLEIRNNLRDLHLKAEEGRVWLSRKQLLGDSPGTKGKVVFTEVGSAKSELCVCADTKECDLQLSDITGEAFLQWQQQKGELVKERAGWIIIQFAPEVSKKDMFTAFSLIWDFLKVLIRGDGREAADWRMVSDSDSLHHAIVMNIENPVGEEEVVRGVLNTLLICWPKLMMFTIDPETQYSPVKVGIVLLNAEGGKVSAFTTREEFDGGVLDIIVSGSEPPKHLNMARRFIIRTGDKLAGFNQLLKDRGTFLTDMLKSVGDSFEGRIRVWGVKDQDSEDLMEGGEGDDFSDEGEI